MRKVSLTLVALALFAHFSWHALAQESGGAAAKPQPSTTPTIDQSLELRSAFSPQLSPDGSRVVYEVTKTNWEDNAFERNLWIVNVSGGEVFMQPPLFRRAQRSDKEFDAVGRRREQALDVAGVLLRQDFGRDHQRGLVIILHRGQHRLERDDGFAAADISL